MSYTVNVTPFSAYEDSKQWRLADFMAELTAAIDKIPAEYLDVAEVSLSTEPDSYYCELAVRYKRPETNAEATERVRKTVEWAERTEAQERARYERLKAKYEPHAEDSGR